MDGELKLELGKAEGSKNFPELQKSSRAPEAPHGVRILEFQAPVLDASTSSSPNFRTTAFWRLDLLFQNPLFLFFLISSCLLGAPPTTERSQIGGGIKDPFGLQLEVSYSTTEEVLGHNDVWTFIPVLGDTIYHCSLFFGLQFLIYPDPQMRNEAQFLLF